MTVSAPGGASPAEGRRIAIACGLIALAVSGSAAALSLSVHGWRASALVRISDREPLAALARQGDPGFELVDIASHYDGAYFYAIARDPLARGEAHRQIDRAAYRYGHAGYGWLAWLASAGGRPGAVPVALLELSLAGVAVAAAAASLLARELGRSAWAGLFVALSPGLVYAVTADTSEPVAMAAVALALLAWTRKRWGWAGVALAAACLIKEPLLALPAGLAIWEGIEWLRGRRSPDLASRLGAIAAGPILFAVWFLYLRVTFDVWPFGREAVDYFTAPFAGWVDSIRIAARGATGGAEVSQVANASVPLIAVSLGALVIGLVRSLRARSFLDPIFALTAILLLCLNWLAVLYPKDLIRNTVFGMALLPAVLAGRAAEPGGGETPPG